MKQSHTLSPLNSQFKLPEDTSIEDAHIAFQNELERLGSDTIAAQLSASHNSKVGMAIYADEYIDCIVASDGFLDRVGRRAGLHPTTQRAILTHYYTTLQDISPNVPTDKDILVIDKTIVSGYEDEA